MARYEAGSLTIPKVVALAVEGLESQAASRDPKISLTAAGTGIVPRSLRAGCYSSKRRLQVRAPLTKDGAARLHRLREARRRGRMREDLTAPRPAESRPARAACSSWLGGLRRLARGLRNATKAQPSRPVLETPRPVAPVHDRLRSGDATGRGLEP